MFTNIAAAAIGTTKVRAIKLRKLSAKATKKIKTVYLIIVATSSSGASYYA